MKLESCLVSVLCLVLPFVSGAQGYEKVYNRNPWNDGKGVVGIRQDSVSVAYAEASGNYVAGGLRASFEPMSSWTTGVRASALGHYERYSLLGSLGFNQFWGNRMAGTMFIRPGYFPIDIYEFTQGLKSRQTYDASFGVSFDLGTNWRAGVMGMLKYARQNKQTDLGHTTTLMDLGIMPGIQYHTGKFAVGVNYLLSKNVETIRASQTQEGGESLAVFLDKGLFYGLNGTWKQDDVFHLIGSLPVREVLNGFSLQSSYGPMYLGFQWRSRSGGAGDGQEQWFRFGGSDLKADISYKIMADRGMHKLKFLYVRDAQSNDEPDASGEFCRIFDRSTSRTAFVYVFQGGGWNLMATAWAVDKKGDVCISFPVRLNEDLLMPGVDVKLGKSLNRWELSLTTGWTDGYLSEKEYADVSEPLTPSSPERLERYFVRFREMTTSHKITVMPQVRYNFACGLYLDASMTWLKGFNMFYLGTDRFSPTLKLGYNF